MRGLGFKVEGLGFRGLGFLAKVLGLGFGYCPHPIRLGIILRAIHNIITMLCLFISPTVTEWGSTQFGMGLVLPGGVFNFRIHGLPQP